jgi:hypothetical protein
MYLVVTARKGISSMQMAKEIGVTQKTGKGNRLSGIIVVDECFVGGPIGNVFGIKTLSGLLVNY